MNDLVRVGKHQHIGPSGIGMNVHVAQAACLGVGKQSDRLTGDFILQQRLQIVSMEERDTLGVDNLVSDIHEPVTGSETDLFDMNPGGRIGSRSWSGGGLTSNLLCGQILRQSEDKNQRNDGENSKLVFHVLRQLAMVAFTCRKIIGITNI